MFRSFDELAALQAHDWMLLVILGVACMFMPGLLQAEGMRRVGAQRAAIGSTIGPPTTILLAALFLGERLNGWQLLGSAMIVGSVLVLSHRQTHRPRIVSCEFVTRMDPGPGRALNSHDSSPLVCRHALDQRPAARVHAWPTLGGV